jgi:TonB family protein
MFKFLFSSLVFLGSYFGAFAQTADAEIISDPVERVPVFEACAHISDDLEEQKICFNRFIMSKVMENFEWPEGLEENGKVFVQVTFDETGKLKDVESVRSYNDLAEQEALRLMHLLPDAVKPSTSAGNPVPFTVVIPVLFNLN